jgi:hypothetical protein
MSGDREGGRSDERLLAVYFEGAIWGAAAALLGVALWQGYTLAGAMGFVGLVLRVGWVLKWYARRSSDRGGNDQRPAPPRP